MRKKITVNQEKSHVFGLISNGQFSEALPLLKNMCTASPKDSSVWLMLGIAQGALGSYREAVESLRQSVQINPGQTEGHYFLGNALNSQGKLMAANNAYQKAIDLKSNYWEAHYAMARVLQQSGKPDSAIESYQKAIAINPENYELHANLGLAWKAVGKNIHALASLNEAARLQPDSAEVQFNMGNLHHGQRELDEAEDCYRKAVQLRPGWIRAHLALGRILLLKGEVDRAIGICRKAHDIDPANNEVVAMEAGILEQVGNLDGALLRLQPLIESGTSDASALITYAKLASHLENHSEVIALLEDKLKSISYDVEDARRLQFVLADTYDAINKYDHAFKHYQSGNVLKLGRFNPDEWSRSVDTIINNFSKDFLGLAGNATNKPRLPVFIVGMPRTGSTLLEQVLSRHSRIYGAGELPDIKNIALSLPELLDSNVQYPECLDSLNQTVIDRVANDHLKRLAGLSGGALRVIDKMPGNYLHLGLIQILFPGATILHTQRDPIDTCFSCFTRDLGGGASFSADLTSLGGFYKGYKRLMEHWQDVLQIKILNVRYEELIEDHGMVVRAIIDSCGLEWENQCLDHMGGNRVVATPSYDQVRKPLYKSSIGKWKHYEAHLGPLIESLEP